MFFEFALEPTAVTGWDSARYFLDAFGPWKGRFLSQYPKDWARRLLASLTCGDVEKKRIAARLEQAKKDRVFYRRVATAFDGDQPWLSNARAEHAREPFRAIIAVRPTGENFVLEAASLDEGNPRWRVDAGRFTARDANAYAAALAMLLRASSRLLIIDPYFRADQPDKTGPLAAFCRLVHGRVSEVHVHFADEARGYAPCIQDARRALPGVLPDGMQVSLHCWRERAGGRRLHNRYLVTDVGGVQFGDGIERGDAGQEDRLSLLDEESRARLWDDFMGSQPGFDLAGAVVTVVAARR
ncbi:MAG: hypothetical protein IPM35_16615 [Myxococcales bacterium]|nr:hypothetical protein [Myxococcales bacterium]